MNTTLFNLLIATYNSMAYAHMYIWGFIYKKTVYMAITDETAIPYVCKIDRASEKADGMALRFCPNISQKVFLLPKAEPLCSEEYFNSLCKEKYLNKKGKLTKYNNGEVFEKLITEKYGQVWEKDNVPFTKSGDIVIDGTHYQIKYDRATFCTEKSLANLKEKEFARL